MNYRQSVFPTHIFWLVLLVLSLSGVKPTLVVADAGDMIRAKAVTQADAIKQQALVRLANEGTHIAPQDQEQFTEAIRAAIEEQLVRLRRAYALAGASLDRSIGYGTSLDAMWKSLWHSEEEAQRVFQEKIDAAITEAGIPAARERMQSAIEAAVLEYTTALYKHSRQIFNRLLAEVIGSRGLLGALTPDLVKELLEQVELTSHQLAVKEGRVEAGMVVTSPKAATAALAAILAARLTESLAARLGMEGIAGGLVGRRLLGLVTGPVGGAILAISAVWDIYNAKSTALEASKAALWQSYHELRKVLTTPKLLRDLTAAATAALEQQLQTDREATRLELDRFFDGILVQANSPGFSEFIDNRDKATSLQGVKKVATVFGREQVEVPFALKYALVSDIEASRATAVLQRHGRGFTDLYAKQQQAVAEVMRSPRYQAVMLDVLEGQNQDAGLLFYKYSLDRFGALDAKQMDALILIRQLHPTKQPEDMGSKAVLTVLGGVVDRLAALKQQVPDRVATLVDWVLQGQMSGSTMQRLAAHAHADMLFALPIQLGPAVFARALQTADETTLVRFVRDLTPEGGPLAQSPALVLLREDAPGHLHLYASMGVRGVLARHRMMQEYGGLLPVATDRTLYWLLSSTSVEAQVIGKTIIDDLNTVGIPGGLWPDILARPVAGAIATMGLTVPLGGMVLIVLLPLGFVWFRVLRFTLPRRRAVLPTRPGGMEVISGQERLLADRSWPEKP